MRSPSHPGGQQRGVKGKGRAGVLGVAAQRQHVSMAVDDAGGRREQGGVAVQRRLQRARGLAGEGLQVEHAIGFGMGPDRLQLFGFLRRGRDDQLAGIPMRDAVIPAVFIERALAADAHPRHQASGGIVDAGVDHLAVARRRDRADAFRRLQNDDLATRLCQPPSDSQTDHPRADYDAINFVHSQFKSGIVGYSPGRPSPLARARGGNCISHIIALFGIALHSQPVEFLLSRFATCTPVSDALIMSGQLP